MFVGKSILASFMLSTAVMVSSPEGTEISDSRINATVLVVSEKPEEAMVSGMPETSETESSQSGTKEPERGQQQETKNSMAAQDTEEPESEEEPEVSQDQEDLSEEIGSEGDEEFEVSPMTGTAMTMLSSQGGAQMLSSVIRSQNGSLVVVDGGWEADGGYLVEHIKANGGVVDAWLITHPHSDHAGALYDILKTEVTRLRLSGSTIPLRRSVGTRRFPRRTWSWSGTLWRSWTSCPRRSCAILWEKVIRLRWITFK